MLLGNDCSCQPSVSTFVCNGDSFSNTKLKRLENIVSLINVAFFEYSKETDNSVLVLVESSFYFELHSKKVSAQLLSYEVTGTEMECFPLQPCLICLDHCWPRVQGQNSCYSGMNCLHLSHSCLSCGIVLMAFNYLHVYLFAGGQSRNSEIRDSSYLTCGQNIHFQMTFIPLRFFFPK